MTLRYDGTTSHDLCDTCRARPATHVAHHTGNGNTWQVCGACMAQAIRYQAPITHYPLNAQTETP